MNTQMRIKSADEFNDIIKTGTKIYSPFFIIYYKEKKLDNPRFGITQAKKFGKAYKRNRYRRILREIIRTNVKVFKNEYDYIIIIMKKCDTLDFKQIEDNLLKVIKEKLWKKSTS